MKPSDSRDRILEYLDTHGVVRKDDQGRQTAVNTCRSRPPVHHTLDLHGLTTERAAQALRSAVEHCLRTGKRKLLVIHGIGIHSAPADGPVLGAVVRQMLDGELRNKVSDYKKAPSALGGDGAVIVYLR